MDKDVTKLLLFQVLTSWHWVWWEDFWLYSLLEWLQLRGSLSCEGTEPPKTQGVYMSSAFQHCQLKNKIQA